MNYTATEGAHSREVSAADLSSLDLISPRPDQYHLLYEGSSYRCVVQRIDRQAREVTLTVNGRTHTVALAGPLQRLVNELGFASKVVAADNEVTAPMPGLILEVAVAEGDTIAEGTPLLILEAMKMENVIKATGAGTVKRIAVRKGEAVEKRQLLIELE